MERKKIPSGIATTFVCFTITPNILIIIMATKGRIGGKPQSLLYKYKNINKAVTDLIESWQATRLHTLNREMDMI